MNDLYMPKFGEVRPVRISEKNLRKEQENAIRDAFNMEFQTIYLGRHTREDWKTEVDEYVVTFRNILTTRTFSMNFSSGIGNKNGGYVVKPLDVLLCIRLDDTRGASFEDWCWEYGYDIDSRKALETYLLCQKQTGEFKKVFPYVDLDSYEPLENY